MNTFHRTTALLLIAISILLNTGDVIAPAAATEPVAAPTELVVEPAAPAAELTLINASAEQNKMVDDAIATFDSAGLDLPPLEIEFFEDEAGCYGHEGLHRPAEQDQDYEADRIMICSRMKIILLHELAHAWKHHNLSEETRASFTDSWGLENWNDKGDAWSDRGIERAAHTIAFALNQSEPTENESVLRYICGYEQLTGTTLEIHTKVAC